MATSVLLFRPLPQPPSPPPGSFRPKFKPWHINNPTRLRFPHKTLPKFSVQDQEDANKPSSSSSVTVAPEEAADDRPIVSNAAAAAGDLSEEARLEQKQEADWKTDEEFKKLMGNPSIEAAIKLEKKRADRRLRELDRESDAKPITRFFKNVLRDSIVKEREIGEGRGDVQGSDLKTVI